MGLNKIDPLIIGSKDIAKAASESYPDTSHGILSWKTLISSGKTSTDSLTAGVATLPPKQGHLCHHRHTQAEIYHIIKGQAIMYINGQEQNVSAGSVVYIPGDAEHGIRNVHPEEELQWLYVFPTASFEDVKYRYTTPMCTHVQRET